MERTLVWFVFVSIYGRLEPSGCICNRHIIAWAIRTRKPKLCGGRHMHRTRSWEWNLKWMDSAGSVLDLGTEKGRGTTGTERHYTVVPSAVGNRILIKAIKYLSVVSVHKSVNQ